MLTSRAKTGCGCGGRAGGWWRVADIRSRRKEMSPLFTFGREMFICRGCFHGFLCCKPKQAVLHVDSESHFSVPPEHVVRHLIVQFCLTLPEVRCTVTLSLSDGGSRTAIPDLLARLCVLRDSLSGCFCGLSLFRSSDFTVSSLIILLTAFITVWYATKWIPVNVWQ